MKMETKQGKLKCVLNNRVMAQNLNGRMQEKNKNNQA